MPNKNMRFLTVFYNLFVFLFFMTSGPIILSYLTVKVSSRSVVGAGGYLESWRLAPEKRGIKDRIHVC